jgi:signal transduction histidine kinase/ActR/RegA family two-component response regulator/CHASE3 domain sensor protein
MAHGVSLFKGPAKFWANRSLRIKGLVAISLPVACILASGLLFFQLDRDKDQAQELARSSLEVRAQLLNIYAVLSSAESAMRNYALTGKEDAGQLPAVVASAIDTALDKVGAQILNSPDQPELFAQFRQKVRARVEGIRQLREFYGAHRADQAAPPSSLVESARILPDITLAVTAFYLAENRLFQERLSADGVRQAKFRAGLLGSLLLGIFGGICAMILFTRGIVRRVRQLELRAAHLEDGVPRDAMLTGNDELCLLAAAMEQAGATLASQHRELRAALENAHVLIWDLDPATQSIRYHAGAGGVENSPLPVEILAPTVDGWTSGVHPEDRDHVRQELQRAVSGGDELDIEYRVVIRGGEVRWMMVRAQRSDSGAGKPERFLGILKDVTDRRRAAIEIESQALHLAESREALEQQTRILKSILDSMGDGVVVADTEGKFLMANPAAKQILGSHAFAGDMNRWAEHYGLFLPDMVSRYPTDQLAFVRAIHGESVDGAEVYIRPAGAPDGSWASVTARPLRQEDGAIRGGVMVLRDITAAKHNADALEFAKREAETANQAKSEFLSRMSHELRTPLNSILGFAQLLELSDLDERGRDNVEHILKGGYHLLDLINEVLDLARIETGRLSLSPEPVCMREALRDALDLVRPLALEQNIHISPEVAIRCDRHVHADRQRLKQVLLNLLSNAIKFNRNGGSIVLACEETSENKLRIEITDSGCGISPEGLKKIFTPFERLAADRTEVGGTGLGLALSKRLVEAMGGTIGVESAVGLGSKFFIELTLLEDPAKWLEDNPAVLEMAHENSESRRGTILYIEDNASNLRLVEQIVAHSSGVQLITAMQGQLGLDLARMHAPDWILLDLHLPDLPGEEVLRRLRQDPRTEDIPVTVLSADATRGQISRLLTAGARDYLTKPVDVRQLLQLLDQTLKHGAPDPNLDLTYAERHHPE